VVLRLFRAAISALVAFSLVLAAGGSAAGDSDLRADSVNLFFDPDSVAPGKSFMEHFLSKRYVFMYREIVPLEASAYTYFAILGSNGGYPDFYGGIQHFKDGTRAAIFSAWDVNSDGTCWTCLPGSGDSAKQVSVYAKGPRTVTKPFGYEGTGMNSMIHGFEWKLNQKVAMLASVEPAGNGSLISAAIKNGDEPWELIASFYVPTSYPMGMPGGYSFVEDWVPGDANARRSYLAGPTYLVDNSGKGSHLTSVYVAANNPTGDGVAKRHAIEVQGAWLKVTTGLAVQPNAVNDQRVKIQAPTTTPEISEGIALLQGAVGQKSDRITENVRNGFDTALAAKDAANPAPILKPKETKITCLKGAQVKLVKGVNPKCPSGFRVQKTIVCSKGNEFQRVSGISPKCPPGFKRR
jgi:hypothetical protein